MIQIGFRGLQRSSRWLQRTLDKLHIMAQKSCRQGRDLNAIFWANICGTACPKEAKICGKYAAKKSNYAIPTNINTIDTTHQRAVNHDHSQACSVEPHFLITDTILQTQYPDQQSSINFTVRTPLMKDPAVASIVAFLQSQSQSPSTPYHTWSGDHERPTVTRWSSDSRVGRMAELFKAA